MPAEAKAAVPVEDRFIPSTPTVTPDPVPETAMGEQLCGVCPGWKRAHPKAPFGQCLPAIKWLGAPMYTPDLAGCTLDPATKLKGASR